MSEKIEKIDIDDLEVDEMNSRKEHWVSDEGLIESIKKVGLLNPLVVRPKEDGKYGIICGSRRYNASIEAGLTEIPCKVEELTDIEAKSASLQENMQRDNLSKPVIAKNIVELWELAEEEGIENKTEYLKEKTGLRGAMIRNYKSIAKLLGKVPVVAELLKPEEERDKERLKEVGIKPSMIDGELDVNTARKISANIGEKVPDSESDILRVSKLGADLSQDEGRKLVDVYNRVKGHSDKAIKKITKKCIKLKEPEKEEKFLAKVEKREVDVQEAFRQLMVKTYKLPQIKIGERMDSAIKRAMNDADMKRPELILEIIRSWLRRKGYLTR